MLKVQSDVLRVGFFYTFVPRSTLKYPRIIDRLRNIIPQRLNSRSLFH